MLYCCTSPGASQLRVTNQPRERLPAAHQLSIRVSLINKRRRSTGRDDRKAHPDQADCGAALIRQPKFQPDRGRERTASPPPTDTAPTIAEVPESTATNFMKTLYFVLFVSLKVALG